jgi:membrane-bound acyltransferase YfiQ involved in biofilm formation
VSAPTPTISKGRLWLNSFIMALAASCGYLIVALMSQHQVLTIVIAMASITLVLTPIFYWTNSRRARLGNAPRRGA